VLQNKETANYMWWVIFKQRKGMKLKSSNTINVSNNLLHRQLEIGHKSSKERNSSANGNLKSHMYL
jgi:hypothetical protein